MHFRCTLGIGLVFAGALSVGCGRERTATAPAPTAAITREADLAAPSVLQVEMRLLEQTLAIALHAIAVGDLQPIGPALHQLHGAKTATEHALESGKYVPPRGGDLAVFAALDEAFHAELEQLFAAAQRDDVPAAAMVFGRLVMACNGCHTTFR